ncbi:MAG: hypothetical protein KC416_01835 [Myxococcales bacterium]|nr:hypothetical protein [Myxococcales bacterium]
MTSRWDRTIDPRQTLYRWDLDKTYLRTEFDTFKDLVRTAFEPPSRKRTVPGAAMLLREIEATDPAGVHILSGSPEQMRFVLETKLRQDGVRWDSFTLKPNLQNLVHGRFRSLRNQLHYKLASLLRSRVLVRDIPLEIMFGDDAEADAYVYSLYADLCADAVEPGVLDLILEAGHLYEEERDEIHELLAELPKQECVGQIFIHLDRVSPHFAFDAFGPRVCPIYNYFQAALVLLQWGGLAADSVLRVGDEIARTYGFSPDALGASFMDLVRRGFLGKAVAQALDQELEKARVSGAASRWGSPSRAFLEDIGPRLEGVPSIPSLERKDIDYVGAFSADRARSRAAKRRVRWRR